MRSNGQDAQEVVLYTFPKPMVLNVEMASSVGEALVVRQQQRTTVVLKRATNHGSTDRKIQHEILNDFFEHLLENQLDTQ